MKTEIVKDKEGKILQTKDGIQLENYFFEDGDLFIPEYNSYMEKPREVMVKDKPTIITERKIKCSVNAVERDEEGNITGAKPFVDSAGNDKVFVILHPTQAKAFDKQKAKGIEPNQIVWKAYTYTNDYGDQVGIGPKIDFKPAISFEEVELGD